MSPRAEGWFADTYNGDHETLKGFWEPCFQRNGHCISMEVWFPSEDECLAFIRENILGLGMMDEP